MTGAHRGDVVDIYNHFVENSYAAYPDETLGYEIFDYFRRISSGYPAVVVKDADGTVVGFAFMSAFFPIQTFERTAAITYFIKPEHTRKGIGQTILERFEKSAAEMGIEWILAHISSLNTDSISFHLKNGFEECGRFRKVGKKFGRVFDVVWMQKPVKLPEE
jgi:phosphinothricin acetyltransferase